MKCLIKTSKCSRKIAGMALMANLRLLVIGYISKECWLTGTTEVINRSQHNMRRMKNITTMILQ